MTAIYKNYMYTSDKHVITNGVPQLQQKTNKKQVEIKEQRFKQLKLKQ